MSRSEKNWKNRAMMEPLEINEDYVLNAKRVPVAEVKYSDSIVVTWKLDENNPMMRVPNKTKKITRRDPCPGGNGMHVHLNKTDCYDSRSMIYVSREA